MANPKSCGQIERELQALKKRVAARPKKHGKAVKWLHPDRMLKLDIQQMMAVGMEHKQALHIALERKRAMTQTTAPAAGSDAFLDTYEWRRARMAAIKLYGSKCQCCGATPKDGARMNVDHIKPRKLFPSLALDINNLQILCNECNHGKGNWDMTDWRQPIAEKTET
jgi:hypothetical protein